MAIKGKNKSKSRSNAPRKTSAAPARRPAPNPAIAVPWYKTMRGQLSVIIVLLAIIGVVMWWVSMSSADSAKLEKRQDALVQYTGEVGTYVTKVELTIREMLG